MSRCSPCTSNDAAVGDPVTPRATGSGALRSSSIAYAAAFLALIACSSTASGAKGTGTRTLRAAELRCEYLVDPLGVEEHAPRLTWIVESPHRDALQFGYRILVASSSDRLSRDEGDLWDSGHVLSNITTHVAYAGKPLASRQDCSWKVMSWDREGEPGAWSAPAHWTMGLLSITDWSAEWIEAGGTPVDVTIDEAKYCNADGSVRKDVTQLVAQMLRRGEPVVANNTALGGDPAYGVTKHLEIRYRCGDARLETQVEEKGTANFVHERMPYLRRSFTAQKTVTSARLYATALGAYEMFLNGERVGTDRLSPGWTDYAKRVRYQVHDVTDRIKPGENVLGAIVAPGWFSGRAGLFHARQFYGTTPALLAQLEITYSDGSSERIATDGSWVRHDGPLLAADILDGEVHDARLEIDGWCTSDIDATSWTPVGLRKESRTLQAETDAPVCVLQQLPARSVTEPSPGHFTFDLGQNMVGVACLRVHATRGTVVTVRQGEMLSPDGTLYTANLRGAAATDTYICKGSPVEVWEPQFTYHGFRYVEVTGLSQAPLVSDVTGTVLGSDVTPWNLFSCSDPRIDRLQANIMWGMCGNYVSIPTDCPQRDERMGWMADAQVFAPTAAFEADVAAFLSKWMIDVDDAQRADGAHSDVAPAMKGLSYGTPAWADAGTIVPWTLYQMYGDERVLERHIDSMVRWVEWCRAHSTGLIRDHDRGNDYGDWLSVDAETPKDLIGTAYFAHSTDLVTRSLRVLGRKDDAEKYAQLFADIKAAFVAKYVDADGRVTGGTQCGCVLALQFDLLPQSLRQATLERLIADIESRGWHSSTGFVGTGDLLPTLSAGGRSDIAYRLLMQDTFPSWLFSVTHGATTIWERWDGWTPEQGVHPDASMNSFNHYAFGSCGRWLFESVAGIQPDPDHPGFEHFSVRPNVAGPLTHASATYRSIHGLIGSHWSVDGDHLLLDIEIPANTRANVFVPSDEGAAVSESKHALDATEGIRVVRRDKDGVLLDVGSGTYAFTSKLTPHSGNPILSGWYADPEVARLRNEYWVYPTTSAPYDEQTYFDAFSSPDLVHWTKHAHVLDTQSVGWAKRAMWAPSVVEKDGKYFFFFAANDIQKDGELGGIGVAVGDTPAGPFTDCLAKPLVGAFHNGAQPIDCQAFKDVDGRYLLVYGGWGHCNIARLAPDFRSIEPFDDGTQFKEITPSGYVEGPFMFVRNGKYVFMWSEGGWTGPDYSVAYAIADSPLGPFRRVGKILSQDPTVATGAGHHSVLHVNETDEYFIVYHRRPLGETDGNHRVVCIDRMVFDADGTIEPVKMTFEGVSSRR